MNSSRYIDLLKKVLVDYLRLENGEFQPINFEKPTGK